MSSSYVCIQCGEDVPSLYIEFSESNFRLTRCAKCGEVADKYVEYELMLVLFDVLMHRRAAFRHLMFNRYSQKVALRTAKVLPFAIVWSSTALKLIILNKLYGMRGLQDIFHASVATISEFLVFLGIFGAALSFSNLSTIPNPQILRLFLAILFPESFKAIALLLYTFDSEPELLFLLSILVLSVQYEAVQCVTNFPARKLLPCFVLALFARIFIKFSFFSIKHLWMLGALT